MRSLSFKVLLSGVAAGLVMYGCGGSAQPPNSGVPATQPSTSTTTPSSPFLGRWVSARKDENVLVRSDGTGQIAFHEVSPDASVAFRGLHAIGRGKAVATVTIEAFVRSPGYAPLDKLTFEILSPRQYGQAFIITNSVNTDTSVIYYRSP